MTRTPAIRPIDLQEHQTSVPIRLSVDERDQLKKVLPSLTIEPASGMDDTYRLTPGSTIGALELNRLSVSISPKLPVPRALFLASYAMGAFKLRDERFDFDSAKSLVEVLALALAVAARGAFANGLLHGYLTEEVSLHTVRGQIRTAEQVRRRFGVLIPLEVRYDEFTDDITANRLVKAAVARLGRMRIRSQRARASLRWVGAMLENVTLVEFPSNAVPDIAFDQLNQHYREVVALSRLVLRSASFEIGRGGTRAPGFLMDMNVVFQDFVTQALQNALRVTERTFRRDDHVPRVTLDEAGQVLLKPDFSWWDGRKCTFVGDAKYKRVAENERVPSADLYQLLAYATALDLPGGLLVYAQGEAEPATHRVRHAGKRLEIFALDLSGTIDVLLARIDDLAESVRRLRNEARRLHHAA